MFCSKGMAGKATLNYATKTNLTMPTPGIKKIKKYSSTTYADEGYLFLLIDFNEKDPLIYIHAWQPNEWDSSALVNTSNFRIYK